MQVSVVKLRNTYNIDYMDTNNIFIKPDSLCIVESEHGVDIGKFLKCSNCQTNPRSRVTGKILRKASADDIDRIPEIDTIEQKAFKICREKAKNKKLMMKLISVKCLFDKTKIILSLLEKFPDTISLEGTEPEGFIYLSNRLIRILSYILKKPLLFA